MTSDDKDIVTVTDSEGDTVTRELDPDVIDVDIEPDDTTTPPDPEPEPDPDLGDDPTPVGTDHFDIQLKSEGGEFLWIARYHRELSSGATWLDGDRDGYRAAYMFLAHPDLGDTLARVLFVGGYGDGGATMVQDRSMNEAERFYDGTVYDGDNRELNDAPRPDGHGPYNDPDTDVRVNIRWYLKETGEVLEKRQYVTPLELADDVKFRVLEHTTTGFTDDTGLVTDPHQVYSRIIIGSTKAGAEMVNVYYDTLDPRVGMDVEEVAAG